MKKILLTSLAALALASCVSDNDLNPVEQYGYINVNVSNDPTVITRAEVSTDDLKNWKIVAKKKTSDGKYETEGTELDAGSNYAIGTGTYKVCASNYKDETAAYTTSVNEGWGDMFFSGETSTDVVVNSGAGSTAAIDCKQAKNARLAVDFSLDGATLIKDCQLKITTCNNDDASARNIVFNANTESKYAYFPESANVGYELSYLPKDKTEETDRLKYSGSIDLNAAATTKKISVSSGDNGTITITVTIDDKFNDSQTNQTITIDAATGGKVSEGTFTPTVTTTS